MLKRILESPSLSFFQKALAENGSFLIEGLWDVPKALLASLVAETSKKSILVITGGTREDSLFDSLSPFAP